MTNFKVMKVFDAFNMDDAAQELFFESHRGKSNDCYMDHDVENVESDEHTLVDAWLLANGATAGEEVIIKHSY